MQKATSEKEVAFKNMARPAGIEPTTSWFVAKHSNPTELRALNQFISIYPLFYLYSYLLIFLKLSE